MPIKRPSQDKAEEFRPTGRIKRVQRGNGDGRQFVGKEDIENHLVVVTVRDFTDKHVGSYGLTNKAVLDVIDLDEGNAKHEGLWVYSGLAGQIGAELSKGESGVGKIVSGPTKNGQGKWWGIEWSDDDSEIQRAEDALESESIPY